MSEGGASKISLLHCHNWSLGIGNWQHIHDRSIKVRHVKNMVMLFFIWVGCMYVDCIHTTHIYKEGRKLSVEESALKKEYEFWVLQIEHCLLQYFSEKNPNGIFYFVKTRSCYKCQIYCTRNYIRFPLRKLNIKSVRRASKCTWFWQSKIGSSNNNLFLSRTIFQMGR